MPSPRSAAGLSVLALVLGLMLPPLPAVAQNADRPTRPTRPPAVDEGDEPTRPGARAPQETTVEKPDDPSAPKGTYTIDGRTMEVTEGDYYDTYVILKALEPKATTGTVLRQRILEHIMLVGLADALGCTLTEEEVRRLDPTRNNPNQQLVQAQVQRWKALGITREQYLRYAAETRAIQRFKALQANSIRVLSQEVYDAWKVHHHLYELGYVEFCADDHEKELRASPPDERTLKRFFESNVQVRGDLRQPTTVTVDVVIFDPKTIDEAELERLRGGGEPAYEESLAYFRRHQERLMAQIPSSERAKLFPPEGTSLEEIVTPFQILREQIEQEMVLKPRIDACLDEARSQEGDWDPAASTARHGLEHVLVEGVDSRALAQRFPRIGGQLFNMAWSTPLGTCAPEVKYTGGVFYFWRLRDKKISTLPTFQDALGMGLEEKYYEYEAYSRAEQAGRDFISAIDAEISKRTSKEEAEIDKEYRRKALEEIKNRGYEDQQQINMTHQRYTAMAGNQKRMLRNEYRPAAFEKVLEERGLELKTLGPFERSMGYADRSDVEDPQRLKELFLKGHYSLQTMQPSEVHEKLISDRVSRCHFVIRLLGKVEPDFEKMTAEEYHQNRTRIEHQRNFTTGFEWSYQKLAQMLNWRDA